jgi:hypothetical protein
LTRPAGKAGILSFFTTPAWVGDCSGFHLQEVDVFWKVSSPKTKTTQADILRFQDGMG